MSIASVELRHVALGDEHGQRPARAPGSSGRSPRARRMLGYSRRRGLVRHVEERARAAAARWRRNVIQSSALRQALGAVVPAAAGPVERDGRERVAHAFARAFVARARRVKSEPSKRPMRVSHRGLVVGVDQLDAVAVRGAMVGGVEVAAVVQLGLARLVVHHRGRGCSRRAARSRRPAAPRARVRVRPSAVDGDRALVEPGGQVAPRVDLDPDRLGASRAPTREREPAAAGARVLGHELHRLPAQGVARARPGCPAPRPSPRARLRSRSCSAREDLDRPAHGVGGIGGRRRVARCVDAAACWRSSGRAQPQRADAPARRPPPSPGRPRSRCARRRGGRAGRPRRSCAPGAGWRSRPARSSRRRSPPTRAPRPRAAGEAASTRSERDEPRAVTGPAPPAVTAITPAKGPDRKASKSASTWSGATPAARNASAEKLVLSATHTMPAARAAATPAGESSKARHAPGGTPMRAAAARKMSGCGLPRGTWSPRTMTVTAPRGPAPRGCGGRCRRGPEVATATGIPFAARIASSRSSPASGARRPRDSAR